MSLDYENNLVSTLVTRGEAEVAIQPAKAVLREQVFGYIVIHGPVTDEQIAEGTGLNPSTARPRRLDLERAGRIVADGTAKTHSGRKAVTWVVAS